MKQYQCRLSNESDCANLKIVAEDAVEALRKVTDLLQRIPISKIEVWDETGLVREEKCARDNGNAISDSTFRT